MRRILRGLVLTAILLGAVGCQSGGATSSEDGFFAIATVKRDRITVSVRALGQVEPLASRTATFGTVGGRITEVLVHEGDEVAEGQPLARLDTQEFEDRLIEAQADLRVAEAELEASRREPTAAEIAAAEAALAEAEAALAKAEHAWKLGQSQPLAALEAAVADAAAALQEAQDRLALEDIRAGQPEIRRLEYEEAYFQRALRDLRPGEDSTNLEKSLNQVSSALARARASRAEALAAQRKAVNDAAQDLENARDELARARSGALDPTAKLELAHERAREKRAQAQEQLDALQAGPDPDALDRAANAYEAALAKVGDIEASIAAATLTSPIDGAVLTLFVATGQWVGASTNIAYVADASELLLTAQVSEREVVSLEPGQIARVSFQSAPHTFYEGELATVASQAQTQDGVALFQVQARLGTVDIEVLPGMTANLWVDVGSRDDVLVIPATAIGQTDYTGTSGSVTTRGEDGAWTQVQVKLGMSDGVLIEVVDGLQEGDEVRIPLQSPSGDQMFYG